MACTEDSSESSMASAWFAGLPRGVEGGAGRVGSVAAGSGRLALSTLSGNVGGDMASCCSLACSRAAAGACSEASAAWAASFCDSEVAAEGWMHGAAGVSTGSLGAAVLWGAGRARSGEMSQKEGTGTACMRVK